MTGIHLPARSLATGLAWAAAVLTTVRFLRHRTDARLAAHWWTVVLLTLSLTCEVPTVYRAVDHILGIPNAAFWLTDSLALGSAYMADTFFYALAHGAERLRWHRRWLLTLLACTLVVMAVALWRVGLRADLVPFDLPQVDPALVAYRATFLAFLGLVMVRVIGTAAYYRRHTPDPLVAIGMTFLLVAGLWGLSYLVCRMATTLLPATTPLARMLNVCVDFSVFMGILCVAVATLVPLWGTRLGIPTLARHLSVLRAYWRLYPLWRALTQCHPEVVLPLSLSRRAALWHPHDLDLLLQRRVIEILDVRRLLLTPASSASAIPHGTTLENPRPGRRSQIVSRSTATYETASTTRTRELMTSPSATTAHDRRQPPQQSRELERQARAEARLLVSHLELAKHRHTDSHSASVRRAAYPVPVPVLFQPATFDEAVCYLQCVAAACRRERWRRRRCIRRDTWEAWRDEERQYA